MLREAQLDRLRNQLKLSTQEVKALFWWTQGTPVKGIDDKIGTTGGTAKIHIANAKNKIGVYSKCRLIELISGTHENYVAPAFINSIWSGSVVLERDGGVILDT